MGAPLREMALYPTEIAPDIPYVDDIGNRRLVRNRTIPRFEESCGENQAFFLWAASLKQEPTEVIQESCFAPERGRKLPPPSGRGCQFILTATGTSGNKAALIP